MKIKPIVTCVLAVPAVIISVNVLWYAMTKDIILPEPDVFDDYGVLLAARFIVWAGSIAAAVTFNLFYKDDKK